VTGAELREAVGVADDARGVRSRRSDAGCGAQLGVDSARQRLVVKVEEAAIFDPAHRRPHQPNAGPGQVGPLVVEPGRGREEAAFGAWHEEAAAFGWLCESGVWIGQGEEGDRRVLDGPQPARAL